MRTFLVVVVVGILSMLGTARPAAAPQFTLGRLAESGRRLRLRAALTSPTRSAIARKPRAPAPPLIGYPLRAHRMVQDARQDCAWAKDAPTTRPGACPMRRRVGSAASGKTADCRSDLNEERTP